MVCLKPWKIKYTFTPSQGGDKVDRHATITSANGGLLVDEEGTYELLEVRDKHCPGSVSKGAAAYEVAYLPRPTLALFNAEERKSGKWTLGSSNVIKRRAICRNSLDSVDITLTGAPPFQVNYEHTSPLGKESKSLFAVQGLANLVLATEQSGLHTYEFSGVSDSIYSKASDGLILNPSASRHVKSVKLEQTVHDLPSGVFRTEGKAPRYCVHDEFGSRSSTATGLVLHLTGQAPFDLELEVKAAGSAQPPGTFPIHATSHEWPVVLPFAFSTAGRYEVTLWSVRDANGCERIIDRSASTSPPTTKDKQVVRAPSGSVDVADTASIAPVQPGRHHCVGDNLDFVLQGIAPWTITYEFNGQAKTITSRSNTFSRLAELPGTFSITKVAHQQNQCSSRVVNIEKEIHPIPRVKVSQGTDYVQDIREGDQADIVFHFEGALRMYVKLSC